MITMPTITKVVLMRPVTIIIGWPVPEFTCSTVIERDKIFKKSKAY